MPISSGAGGKPNSYFNPTNALSRRSSVVSIGHGGGYGGGGGYYYGAYPGDAGVTPRTVQVVEMPPDPTPRAAPSGRAGSGRRCCPCPSRSRQEMRLPQMPKSKLGQQGSAISRRGCCIFLLGLLALALVAGVVAGLYFLGTELTNIRLRRAAFYLIPGRRTGDLMWLVYGRTQECEPETTLGVTTTAAVTTADPNATTVSTTPTTTGTTLIPCASTTFRYEQVSLGCGGWPKSGILVCAAALSAVAASALSRG